jgi:formylglycine-generating enzyme required for sulfatase activity
MNHSCRWRDYSRLLAMVLVLAVSGTAPAAEPTYTVDLGGDVKIELLLVQAGTFTQGSPAGEKNRGDDETQRQVTISQPFYLGKTPVTRGQFAKFVAATGYKTEAEKGTSGGFGFENGTLVQKAAYNWHNPGFTQTDEHPVVLVTWDDAQAFAKWLSGKTKQSFELPTEAEWEYAIRAGTTTAFYSGDGDHDADRIAWHKGTAGDGTRPVGQKEPNAWGFVDMAGNVWEWCRDWYGPYSSGQVTDPLETRSNQSNPPRRVLRGGSFLKDAKNGRSAARFRSTPGTRNADTGFRVMFRPAHSAVPAAVQAPVKEMAQPVESPAQPPTVVAQQETQRNPPRQPAQPAQSSPNSPPPTRGPMLRSSLMMGLLCPCALLVVGGTVIIVLLLVWRGQRKSSQDDYAGGIEHDVAPPPGPQPGSKPQRAPRIVNDGFWLEDPAYSPGSVVRYSYRVGHTPHSGEFTVGPGHQGHFVYTGGTPSDIQILEILSGTGILPGSQPYDSIQSVSGPVIIGSISPPPPPSPRRTPPSPPPHRTGGFPPAY